MLFMARLLFLQLLLSVGGLLSVVINVQVFSICVFSVDNLPRTIPQVLYFIVQVEYFPF